MIRSDSLHSSFAIVMHSIALQESDKLVHLITEDFGKVSAVARRAARSVKRFGAALEPFCFVKAQLKAPKNFNLGHREALWVLESVDLKNSFTHLRQNYGSLNAAASATRLIMDNIPDGPTEVEIFRAYGRFLRDSEVSQTSAQYEWNFVAFWVWLGNFMGFGRFDAYLWDQIGERSPEFLKFWQTELSQNEAPFRKIFEGLVLLDLKAWTRSERERLYQEWIKASGLAWPFFEKNYLSSFTMKS